MQADMVGKASLSTRAMTGIAARVISQASCTRIRLCFYVLFKSLKNKERKRQGNSFLLVCLIICLFRHSPNYLCVSLSLCLSIYLSKSKHKKDSPNNEFYCMTLPCFHVNCSGECR